MLRDKSNVLFLLPLYALVAVVIYWPAHTGGWYFDDFPNIVWNPSRQNLDIALQQLTSPRGLTFFTFALDRYFWGLDPTAWRWVNVVLHVVNSLLVVQLFRQLTGAKGWRAVLFGLLFLCHPVQSSAVSYIVQRMAVLSAFFALVSIIFADRYFYFMAEARQRAASLSLVLALVCFILACMAKENVVMLPVVVLALAWFRGGGALAKGWRQLVCAVSCIPVVAIALRLYQTRSISGLMSGNFVALVDTGGAYYVPMQDSALLPLRYFLSQLEAFWLYLGLLLLPLRQALDYSRPIPQAVPTLLQVGTFLLGAVLCYWAFRQRSRYPLTLFGLVWICAFMFVESSFIPLDPVFEHRLYLPFFGWGLILYEQLGRLGSRMMLGFFLLMVGCYAALTVQRNAQWGDAVSLWEENVALAPRSSRPLASLAQELFAAGRYTEVVERLSPAKEGQKGFFQQRLGEALYFADRQPEAFASFRKAQQDDPTLVGFELFYAAHSALVAGDYDSAERLLALAEKNDARNIFGLYLRGQLNEGRGELPRAVEFYQKCISGAEQMNFRKYQFTFDASYADWARTRRSQLLERLSGWLASEKAEVDRVPNDVVRRVNWANHLLTLGLFDDAISEYLVVKQKAPNVWQALFNLGLAYEKIGRRDLAVINYRESLKLVPDNVEVQFNYVLLIKDGDARQAQTILDRLLVQKPGDGRIWLAYGEVLASLGYKDRAVRAFAQAALLPGYRGIAKLRLDELGKVEE